MTKDEIIESMRAQRAKLMAALAPISAENAATPRVIGEWSTKDLVAHLVAWEEEAVKRLELIEAGRDDEVAYIGDSELDEWNARAVEARRDVPWQQLLGILSSTRERLMEIVGRMDAERLLSESGPVPVPRWLPVFTYLHDEEHIPELAAQAAN